MYSNLNSKKIPFIDIHSLFVLTNRGSALLRIDWIVGFSWPWLSCRSTSLLDPIANAILFGRISASSSFDLREDRTGSDIQSKKDSLPRLAGIVCGMQLSNLSSFSFFYRRRRFTSIQAFSCWIIITMSLFRNAFNKVGRRFMSTSAQEASGGAGALATAVGTTFVTYMTADFLSNFIQHPTQQVRHIKHEKEWEAHVLSCFYIGF